MKVKDIIILRPVSCRPMVALRYDIGLYTTALAGGYSRHLSPNGFVDSWLWWGKFPHYENFPKGTFSGR